MYGLISRGVNSFPLCKCSVSPIISGIMIMSRHCVLTGDATPPFPPLPPFCFLAARMCSRSVLCSFVNPFVKLRRCLEGSSLMNSSMDMDRISSTVCPRYVKTRGNYLASPFCAILTINLAKVNAPSSSRVRSGVPQCFPLFVPEESIFQPSWVYRRVCVVLHRADARPRSLLVPSQPATSYHGTVAGRILVLL